MIMTSLLFLNFSMIANTSKLQEEDRYPLIPLEGNRMTSRDKSQKVLKFVTIRVEGHPAVITPLMNVDFRVFIPHLPGFSTEVKSGQNSVQPP